MLRRLEEVFGLDAQAFSEDEEARLVAALREALLASPSPTKGKQEDVIISHAEIREVAASMPAAGRTLIQLHRRHREAVERLEALIDVADRKQQGGARRDNELATQLLPYEEARDFFFSHHENGAELDARAESCHDAWELNHAVRHRLVDVL